jgi:hypothetical protein
MDIHRGLKLQKVLKAVLRGGRSLPQRRPELEEGWVNPVLVTPEQQQAQQQAQQELEYTLNALANHKLMLESYVIPDIRHAEDTDDILKDLMLPELPQQYDVDMSLVSPSYQQFDEDTEHYFGWEILERDETERLRELAEAARVEIIQWITGRITELTPQ